MHPDAYIRTYLLEVLSDYVAVACTVSVFLFRKDEIKKTVNLTRCENRDLNKEGMFV